MRRIRTGILIQAAGVAVALSCPGALGAATVLVDDDGDSVALDGLVTLREALISLNAGQDLHDDVTGNRSGAAYSTDDRIEFAIGSGSVTITLATPLPPLRRAIRIDGTSQPGFVSTPLIVIDGGAAGAAVAGLVIGDGAAGALDALEIRSFTGHGVLVGSLLFADGFEVGGITAWNGGGLPAADVELDHLVVGANGGDGIRIDALGSVVLRNFDIHDNAGTGLLVLQAAGDPGLAVEGPSSLVADNGGDGVAFGNAETQSGPIAARLYLTEIRGNEIGLRIEQRGGAATTTTEIVGAIVHDNRDSGVRLASSYQAQVYPYTPFRNNKVFHNAIGEGCLSEQTAPQIAVVGPVVARAETTAACTGAAQEACEEAPSTTGEPCYWTGSTCIVVWNLGGAFDCNSIYAEPNQIHSYNTSDADELSVGLYASAGALVHANSNSWRTGEYSQNVDQCCFSFVVLDTYCGGSVLTCVSPAP